MNLDPTGVWGAFKFLFIGPVIVAFLYVVDLMTAGHWWHWAALGIGIAWVFSFFRVVKAAVLVGGLAALVALLKRRS